MSEAKDTLLRLLALLRLIPREPQFVAATTLLEKLKDRGFSVNLRSIQRDLNRLSVPFSLLCDESERPYRWSFSRNAPVDLSAMDTPTALALYLAESHLHALLPQSVLDQLGPQFQKARNYLDNLGRNGLANWAKRVRALPNGKALLPAQVPPEVWFPVSAALLERKQLQVQYMSRSKAGIKRFRIHPAGMVSRHSISYLIGTSDDYSDLRQFALHRIRKAELLNTPAHEHKDFDLDHYIAGGAFAMRQAPQQVELIADVHPQIAWLLSETPLGQEQSLQPLLGSDWHRLRATVPLDQETLWWIFGLNDHIRVHAPRTWAEQIREKLVRMRDMYAMADDTP
ncbi:WYL domain-containing protein [Metapseudomonas lalkuanensis]|uniref:helix-turn-helix transcriptional regulator n=1 Tax=Metapseudomonas lalkuanensis TaxID=2604832 RepID=UPI001CF5C1AA|nr:WYL domain-containing protein [Pseudomonas lalkuanensis]UCO96408.1 WYL domain-containing protein [Pseudomonas lalkuanensis]